MKTSDRPCVSRDVYLVVSPAGVRGDFTTAAQATARGTDGLWGTDWVTEGDC